MHLTVELLRTADGRLEGTVATDGGSERSFSGTLDLLPHLPELGHQIIPHLLHFFDALATALEPLVQARQLSLLAAESFAL